ncbi:MAG: DUF1598 domain-containing protein [Planctomycetia bacterium]|nr:DUF1598 domain-containing protein [Planctomycetia bacterium]
MALLAHRRFAEVARKLMLGLVAGWTLTTLLPTSLLPSAAAADLPERIRAQAEAGEFSTAFAAAGRLPVAERDEALRNIAAIQAKVGSGRAALETVGSIRSDRLRSDILAQFGTTSNFDSGGITARPANGGQGGAARPDFESLIELMTSTIAPESWREAGGTQGEVKSHRGGVFVDATGGMKPIVDAEQLARLGSLRREAARGTAGVSARSTSSLRKVSLTRLERELQLRAARGLAPTEELATLAGLQKIQYVLVYPESGDVVLAGPAGDWYVGRENRLLAVDTDRPVVLLDDLVNLMRREFLAGGNFGCSIDPTPEGLQKVTAFVTESNKKPLAPGARPKWMDGLRDALGPQKITVDGLDPTTRAARILVEADYRMKLVGIGREESVPNVPSYLDMVKKSKGTPPAMDLLRWWFTLNYDALLTSPEHDVYELRGQGIKLLSENEFLAARGQRVQSGRSDNLNQEFAVNFTKNFPLLAQKYPIYAELQNIFDLALVCAVLKQDGVCDRIEWQRSGFMNPRVVQIEHGFTPTTVDTVVNSREISKSLIVASVSGGVTVDVTPVAQPKSMEVDSRGQLLKLRQSVAPKELANSAWWWD